MQRDLAERRRRTPCVRRQQRLTLGARDADGACESAGGAVGALGAGLVFLYDLVYANVGVSMHKHEFAYVRGRRRRPVALLCPF
jgi:hypothetical protein